MKEIKFRAWDGEEMLPNVVPMSNDEILSCCPLASDYRIDKVKAIMQYTGLKDSEGREIYEGDIIKVTQGREIVKWESHGCGFYPFSINPNIIGEVIGNIYENKDLLEE